ncbi:MAG: WG repeat-containing protein, partial [Epsilonproteobacteria bacterium]|nr:WG repeat-containing protein [Campylobacterota bacterium]
KFYHRGQECLRYGKLFLFLFIVIFLNGCDLTDPKKAECSYIAKASKQNPEPEFQNQGICGEFFDEDTLLVYSKHLDNMNFSEDNLTSLYTNSGIFYVLKSGKVVRTFFFDNGADFFEEGLTRTIAKKKFGFMNRKLEVVIPPQFDFAFPFEDGKAIVCNGCRQEKEERGEHMRIVGGQWGAIDKQGNVIVPLVYDSKEVYGKL